jgi:DNA invertase Pin-like site-specific DNA recombinase
MKTALYSRTSTNDGRQHPENQSRQLRAWCQAHGREIAGEFVDQARATNRLRPGLNAMLRAAQAGEFGQVIVTRWDRLARDWAQLRAILATVEASGVEVVAVDDPLQPEVAMRVAALETATQSSRIRSGLARVRASGKHVGRPRNPALPSALSRRLAMAAQGMRELRATKPVGLSQPA